MEKINCVLEKINNRIDLTNLEISNKLIYTDKDIKATIGELKCEEPKGSFLILKNERMI
jgi:hypothetical protein